MQLNQLYKNFGTSSPEEQAEYIAQYRLRRAQDLEKIPSTKKKASKPVSQKVELSEEEKALMKKLGLKMKDIVALRSTVEDEVNDEDEVALLKDNKFDEGDEE